RGPARRPCRRAGPAPIIAEARRPSRPLLEDAEHHELRFLLHAQQFTELLLRGGKLLAGAGAGLTQRLGLGLDRVRVGLLVLQRGAQVLGGGGHLGLRRIVLGSVGSGSGPAAPADEHARPAARLHLQRPHLVDARLEHLPLLVADAQLLLHAVGHALPEIAAPLAVAPPPEIASPPAFTPVAAITALGAIAAASLGRAAVLGKRRCADERQRRQG